MKTLVPLAAFIGCAFVVSACAGLNLVRVAQPAPGAGPPTITQWADLGSLPLPTTGGLSQKHHDGRPTPGEFLAVLGNNLGTQTKVSLGGKDLPHQAYLQEGLVVRIPRGLSPFGLHMLKVANQSGADAVEVPVVRQLMGADSDGGKLRFLPLGPHEELGQEPEGIEIPGLWTATLSPSGGLAWAIDFPSPSQSQDSSQTSYRCKLYAIHLGARDAPESLGHSLLTLNSPPSAMAMLEERTLVVLAEGELIVLDTSSPSQARVQGRLALGQLEQTEPSANRPRLNAALTIHPGPKPFAVVLEVYGNQLIRIDLSDPKNPVVLERFKLAGAAELPLSVDLARDPENRDTLWVIMGPNFRVAGAKIKSGMAKLKGKVHQLWARATGTKASTPVPEMPKGDASVSRLVKVVLQSEGMAISQSRLLPPGFFPLFIKPLKGNEQLISGVGTDVFNFTGIKANTQGIKRIMGIVKGSLELGKILHLKPDGYMKFRFEGTAIYFNLDSLPSGKLLTTVLRPGVGGFPPSVKGDWGVEVEGKGFSLFRRLGYRSLLPPYSVGLIGLQ